jgi:hypothetical protein
MDRLSCSSTSLRSALPGALRFQTTGSMKRVSFAGRTKTYSFRTAIGAGLCVRIVAWGTLIPSASCLVLCALPTSCRARTDHQERLARVAHHHDCVYFVRPEERPELVKIGRATNLFQRLSSLQTGSASRLVLIATAPSGDLEKHYHALFAASRVRHEWFKLKDSAVADAPGVSPVLGIWDESFLE